MDFELTTITAFFKKGGIFIYPIALCSIVGLTLFLQKLWTLKTTNVMPEKFLRDIRLLLSKRDLDTATALAGENDSSIARIAFVALKGSGKSREVLIEDIEEAGRKEALELGRFNEGLGGISTVSTLLGLLGTISGMIKIFDVIARQTVVNPQHLAGGISEALYTTALGLGVAIPAFIAYKYFTGRVEHLVTDLEIEGRYIMDQVHRAGPGSVPPTIGNNKEPSL